MAGEKVSKEDIKKVLDKARKGAGAKIDKSKERIVDKSETEELKTPEQLTTELLKTVKTLRGQVKTLQEQVKSVTSKEDSETTGKTNQQLLDEAEREQEQGEQTEQPQGQITQEEYQKLPAEQKVKILEQELQRRQGPTAEEAMQAAEIERRRTKDNKLGGSSLLNKE